MYISCGDPESFVRGGPTLTTSFLVDEWREDPSTTISGPSSARQRNAIHLMEFCWHADDGPTLNAGLAAAILIRPCMARKPYIFVIFQECSGPLSPPLDPKMHFPKETVSVDPDKMLQDIII